MSEKPSPRPSIREQMLSAREQRIEQHVTYLNELRSQYKQMVTLAMLVSTAVRISPALLRAVRHKLMPTCPSYVEAQLWTSDLVQSSDREGVTLTAWAKELLRREAAKSLSPAKLNSAWELVEADHRGLSALKRLEAKLSWLEMQCKLNPQKERDYRQQQSDLISSLVEQIRLGEPSSARWVVQSLPQLELEIQSLPQVMLAQEAARYRLPIPVRYRVLIPSDEVRDVYEHLSSVLPEIMPIEKVAITYVAGKLRLERAEHAPASGLLIEVPKTYPLRVRVSWREGNGGYEWLELPTEKALFWPLPAGVSELELHNAWGKGQVVRVSEPALGRREESSFLTENEADNKSLLMRLIPMMGSRLILRPGLNREDAEDIQQSIVEQILRHPESFRRLSDFHAMTFARQMAYRYDDNRRLRERYLSSSTSWNEDVEGIDQSPEYAIESAQLIDRIVQFIQGNSDDMLLFKFYFVQGLSAQETANQLNIPLNYLYKRVAELRLRIRRMIDSIS